MEDIKNEKYIFIINPHGRNGKNKILADNIKKICTDENLDFQIRETYRAGSATDIAKEYKDKNYIIYAVGGDGIISEVVNGIVGTNNSLAVIPAGSGNDFYRTIKETINSGEVIKNKIAVGKINNKYFINTACIGMDADVASNVFRMRRMRIPKKWLYTTSIIYTLFHFKQPKVKIEIDNKVNKNEHITILAICNGRYYGGGYNIAPKALIQDDKLDIYYVKKINIFKIIYYLLKMKNGKHENLKHMDVYKASRIKVSSDFKVRFNRDGEMLSAKDFEIELIPNAISLYRNIALEENIIKGL